MPEKKDVFKKGNRYKAYQNSFRIQLEEPDEPDDVVIVPPKVNMLSLGISPEAQFYSTNNEMQVQATAMFILSYNFLQKREGLNVKRGLALADYIKDPK